jgi:parallel beta-helix repeat protein
MSALSPELGISLVRAGTTLVVPDNYPTIQAAINAAGVGSIVFVKNGTYDENLVISKSISLLGEDSETTVIDGGGTGDVVSVSMNNVTVAGFTIRNSGQGYAEGNRPYTGIGLDNAENCSIYGNIITNNRFGVLLYSSSHSNEISENNITANQQHGIGLSDSSNYNKISGNNITSNKFAGIEVYQSDSNLITGNAIAANGVGGIYVTESSSNTIIENNFTQHSGLGSIEVGISSSHNVIFHNNFYANDRYQVSVDSDCQGNLWDNGYPSGGNYWNNYTGKDSNGDGIGDSAYVIDGNNKDNYPLMNPWTASWVPKAVMEAPFWMQLWFWTIVLAGTVLSSGTFFLLRTKKLQKIDFKHSKLGLALKQLNSVITVAVNQSKKHIGLLASIIFVFLFPMLALGVIMCLVFNGNLLAFFYGFEVAFPFYFLGYPTEIVVFYTIIYALIGIGYYLRKKRARREP